MGNRERALAGAERRRDTPPDVTLVAAEEVIRARDDVQHETPLAPPDDVLELVERTVLIVRSDDEPDRHGEPVEERPLEEAERWRDRGDGADRRAVRRDAERDPGAE